MSATAGPATRALASCQPTWPRARWPLLSKRIAGFRGQVDSADEGDAVVDDDRLLVVAVHRPLLRIERAADLRAGTEALAHPSYRPPRGPKHRQRRSRPDKHTHLDLLSELSQKIAQNRRLSLPRQREVRREEPASDVDVRLGPLEFRHHPGKRFGTVDQDIERSSRARRRVTGGPATPRSIKRYLPADPLEPAPMVGTDGTANRRSQMAVSTEHEIGGHGPGRRMRSDRLLLASRTD
jgi:hypothetical protein